MSVQYREVKRKANVGERIRVIGAVGTTGKYQNGDVLTVERVWAGGIDAVGIDQDLWDKEYVVLEPVETEASPADLNRTVDGLLDTVANLVRRVTELERVQKPIGSVEYDEMGFEKVPVGAPINRDDIIEQAKRDVAELTAKYTKAPTSYVTFVINREKRTVVALRYVYEYGSYNVDNRGIAKCAPDDCFNVHIGKAIALRRALGLDVPAEYAKVPQPTEVRVGDIVWYTENYPRLLVTEGKTDVCATPPTIGMNFLRTTSGNRIIDDSREEVGA